MKSLPPITLLLFILTFSKLDRYFFKANDSFCPRYILPNWSYLPTFETKQASIDAILNQSFTYLTKGKQCFVFLSQDRQWVLKFPRLPRNYRYLSFHKPLENVFFLNTLKNGKWIYEQLGKETGIVYAHLKLGHHLGKIHLIDRFQEEYVLFLDHLPFFIQKYGENFFSFFDRLENPKPLIEKTVQLFCDLYEKGFIDRDPILDKNFGIIEGTPFIMDIGQLEKCTKLPPKETYLSEMTQSLGGKLARESPELYQYYKKLLQ